jgi:hypothetical protein
MRFASPPHRSDYVARYVFIPPLLCRLCPSCGSGTHPPPMCPCPVSNISNYLTSRTNPPAPAAPTRPANPPGQPARPTRPANPPGQPARPTRPANPPGQPVRPTRAQPPASAAAIPLVTPKALVTRFGIVRQFLPSGGPKLTNDRPFRTTRRALSGSHAPWRAQPRQWGHSSPGASRSNTISHTGTTRHAISDRSPVLVAITTKTGERSAVPHYVPGACQATVHRGAYQEHHAHLKSSSAPSPHPRPRAILTEESCASLRLPLGPAPFTSPASCAPAFLPGPFPAGLE